LAIGVAVTLQAGPLIPPPTAVSGGSPVSTMKTLDQVTPTWDRILPANNTGDSCNSSRFTCVMGNQAVRDNETGLVWQRSPDGINRNWFDANSFCTDLSISNRKGWAVPTVQELASLIDSSQASLALPNGHPFTNVRSSTYWSATSANAVPNGALAMSMQDGDREPIVKDQSLNVFVWCVRNGRGVDTQ
jgi:hypothetical protein